MIQGFCTRWVTDQVIKPFVESSHGIIHKHRKEVNMLSQTTWYSFIQNGGTPSLDDIKKYPIVVFGVLRGTGDLIKQCETIKHTYYHIDHAYHFQAKEHHINPILNDKMYRITKNGLMINYIDKLDEKFIHWYADVDYMRTLKKLKIRHVLVTSSIIYHEAGVTSKYIDKKLRNYLTDEQKAVFLEKWKY